MSTENDFTRGDIIWPLLKFVVPVFGALFLQAMYGAVDLLVVGQFSDAAEVAAVSTGAQVMHSLTMLINAFAMGTTIALGQSIGAGERGRVRTILGASVALFCAAGALMTVGVPLLSYDIAAMMQTPPEAQESAAMYLTVCGLGSLPLILYNLFGSVFRGIGDSKTPLVTVAVACFFNILGDLWLVACFGMGAKGAALATVAAQVISVVISYALARRHPMTKDVNRRCIRFDWGVIRRVVSLGAPIALQDVLVSISFLVLLGIINSIGLTASAGGGVAQRICGFIMLVPASFMNSMSAFVAQNIGAMQFGRAKKALAYGIAASTTCGVVMFYCSFFHGDVLAGIFTGEPTVVAAAADYLKAYAVDCLMTCFLFCFIGYYNGVGMTKFVMMQGLVGAFLVRIPVSLYMSEQAWATLFHIGLATPCSTAVQIVLCLLAFRYAEKSMGRYRKA